MAGKYLTIGVAEYVLRMRDEFTDQVRSFTGGINSMLTPALGQLAGASLKIGTEMTDAFKASAAGAIDFESAFTGVRKTLDASDPEFEQIGAQLRKMSTEIPVSAEELSNLAAMGAQLGISKDHIVEFARTIADLGVATNLAGEEGATMLARFANITGMPQEQIGNLASTIVDLGNHSATTEAEIAEMALRIAGAGTTAHISQPDILGIATALSSVGINAEAGGSAISKVIIQIASDVASGNSELELFAQVAGQSADEFAAHWKSAPAEALGEFINGLKDIDSAGGDVFATLEALDIVEVRMRDALLRSANAGELFGKSLDIANKAWSENTALAEEANRRYGTTDSQLKIFNNTLDELKRTLGEGLLPMMKEMLELVKPLVISITDFAKAHPDLASGMMLAVGAGGLLLSTFGKLAISLAAIRLLFGGGAIAAGAGAGGAAAGGGAAAAGGAAAGGLAGSIAATGAAFVAVAVAAGLATWAIWEDIKAGKSLAESLMQQHESAVKSGKAMDNYIQRLKDQGVAIDESKLKGKDWGGVMHELAEQQKADSDEMLRYAIRNYTGQDATEEQFAVARNLRLNENLSANEAAAFAVLETNKSTLIEIMQADRTRSENYKDLLLADVNGNVYTAEQIRAIYQQRVNDAAQADDAAAQATAASLDSQVSAHQQAADQVQSIWSRIGQFFSDLWNTVSGWISQMLGFGGASNPNTGPVPGLATGGMVTAPGMVQLHANELLMLPRGAEVVPAAHTAAVANAMAGGGGTINIAINNPVVRERGDIDQLAKAVGNAVARAGKQRMRARGLQPNFAAGGL